MEIDQVAAQLYTIREFTQTPESIATSFEKLAKIGYRAVQLSAMDPIGADEVKKMAADNGLTICATHANGDDLRTAPDKVVDELRALDCQYTAYPFPKNVDLGSVESVDTLIADLDKATRVLAAAGQVLTYHNHQTEFRKLEGETVMDRIYRKSCIQGEIDTYWVQFGGESPVEWCKKLRDRIPLLHLKDYKITDDGSAAFCEIGAGTLDFSAIIREAEASGCKWFIVEQDTCPGDPFDSLKQSYDYIKANLIHL